MATKTAKKISTVKKLDKAKSTIKKVNNSIIDSSFDVIKTAIKNGEKWQKLSKKMVKKSEPLMSKQSNILIDTSDAIKEQFESGTDRFKTLVGYDPKVLEDLKKKVSKTPVGKEAKKVSKKAEKVSKKLKKDIKKSYVDAKDKLEDVAEDVKNNFEDTSEKIEKVVEHTVEDVKKTFGENKKSKTAKKTKAKRVAKKVSKPVQKVSKPVKKVTKPAKIDDLKVVHTIGPKMESILNENGIFTYATLAKTSVKNLESMLEKSEVNAKTYNFTDWKNQAKLAANNDMKGLEVLKKEIKEVK